MTLSIISSDSELFNGEASVVKLPGMMGEFTVLNHHARLLAALTKGRVKYVEGSERPAGGSEGNESSFEIDGGVVSVDNNRVVVCVF